MPMNEILAIGMLVAFFALLMAGIPVALTLATAGLVFGYIGFGPLLFNLLPNRIYGVVTNYTVINGEGCLYTTTAHNMSHWDYSTGFRCCADLP